MAKRVLRVVVYPNADNGWTCSITDSAAPKRAKRTNFKTAIEAMEWAHSKVGFLNWTPGDYPRCFNGAP